MQIARVVGTLVSTQKHRKFDGAKLLLVQPGECTAPIGGLLHAHPERLIHASVSRMKATSST